MVLDLYALNAEERLDSDQPIHRKYKLEPTLALASRTARVDQLLLSRLPNPLGEKSREEARCFVSTKDDTGTDKGDLLF